MHDYTQKDRMKIAPIIALLTLTSCYQGFTDTGDTSDHTGDTSDHTGDTSDYTGIDTVQTVVTTETNSSGTMSMEVLGDADDTDEESGFDASAELVHPLLGVKKTGYADSGIPGITLHRAPSGARYAVEEVAENSGYGMEYTSGVVELDVSRYVPEDRGSPAPKVKVSDALLLASVEPGDPIDMIASATIPEGSMLRYNTATSLLEQRIASVGSMTIAEYQEAKDAVARDIERQISEDLSSVVGVLRARGYGDSVIMSKYTHQVGFAMHPGYNTSLLTDSEFLSLVDVVESVGVGDVHDYDDAPTIVSSNYELTKSQDTEYHIAAGYDGDRSSQGSVNVGWIEKRYPLLTHVTFREGSGSDTRIRGWGKCTVYGCSDMDYFGGSVEDMRHGTSTGAILMGDANDGQYTHITNSIAKKERSSSGSEAKGWFLMVEDYKTRNAAIPWDWFYGKSKRPSIINASWGYASTNGVSCAGESVRHIAVDEGTYERGMLVFGAAGNHGNTKGDTGCAGADDRIVSGKCIAYWPGTAYGAVSVGGHGNGTTYDNQCDLIRTSVYKCSSRGGYGDRTLIDIAGHVQHRGRTTTGHNEEYFPDERVSGTSSATPDFASMMVNFIDMYRTKFSSSIDDPGRLKVWSLLHGTGMYPSGYQATGFDHTTGAGRARAIVLTEEWLDGPYRWTSGSVCIAKGENVDLSLGSSMDHDNSTLKAVTWSYNRGGHDNGDHNVMALRLRDDDGTILRDSSGDVKNKVIYNNARESRRPTKLRISADHIGAGNVGCGSSSKARVYYAYIAEDNWRNDPEGPIWSSGGCLGKQPSD